MFYIRPSYSLHHLLGYIVSHPVCFFVYWLLILFSPSSWNFLSFVLKIMHIFFVFPQRKLVYYSTKSRVY